MTQWTQWTRRRGGRRPAAVAFALASTSMTLVAATVMTTASAPVVADDLRTTALRPVAGFAAVTAPAAAPAGVRRRAALTARWSALTATLGQADVTVSGRLVGRDQRPVQLESRVGERWVVVAGVTVRGKYRLAVPTDVEGTFRYRVAAPATTVARGKRRTPLTALTGAPVTFEVLAPTAGDGDAPPVEEAPEAGAGLGDPSDFTFIVPEPARWNPCTTINYRVNPTYGPPSALRDTKGAAERIEAATGLDLEYVGTTDLVPQQADGAGYPRDTQIVVAWASRSQSPMITGGSVAGVGGPLGRTGRVDAAGRTIIQWERGTVVLNSAFNATLPAGFGQDTTVGKLVMHELGHVVGLGHAREQTQIMFPQLQAEYPSAWGAGDLTGLRKQGAGEGCIYRRDGSLATYTEAAVGAVTDLTVDTVADLVADH